MENTSLYVKIFREILRDIQTGVLRQGDRLPTESELMKQYSVSRITAKRALDDLENKGYIYRKRGSGSFVLPFNQAAEEPVNTFTPAEKGPYLIAAIMPTQKADRIFYKIMQGAADFFSDKNFRITLYTSSLRNNLEREVLLKARADGCAGIIYYPGSVENAVDILFEYTLKNYPVVMLDRVIDKVPLSYVVSDNFNGYYNLTNLVIGKGHKKIAFVGSTYYEFSSLRERFLGYCKALSQQSLDHGGTFFRQIFSSRNELINYSGNEEEYMKRLINILSELKEKGVTAVCCSTDEGAMQVIRACAALNYSVPDDLAVTGFDDSEFSALTVPAITTVKQDYYEIGRTAAKEIYRKIKNPDRKNTVKIIGTQIIERQSL